MTIPRRITTPTLMLADLQFRDEFSMLCGWRPPKDSFEAAGSRWVTWADFLGEYAIVRAEFLAAHPRLHDGRLPFAERVYQFVETHGIDHLNDQEGVTL